MFANRSAFCITVVVLIAGYGPEPVTAGSQDSPTTARRDSITTNGLTIEFPAAERDLVERFASDLVNWATERKRRMSKTVEVFSSGLGHEELHETTLRILAWLLGQDKATETMRQHYAQARQRSSAYLDALGRWMEAFRVVRFWYKTEVEERLRDGEYRFTDFRFSQSGDVSIVPSFQAPESRAVLEGGNYLVDLSDIFPERTQPIAGFELDWVLTYRDGTPLHEIIGNLRSDLDELMRGRLESQKALNPMFLRLLLAPLETVARKNLKELYFGDPSAASLARASAKYLTSSVARITLNPQWIALLSRRVQSIAAPENEDDRRALLAIVSTVDPWQPIPQDQPLRDHVIDTVDGMLQNALDKVNVKLGNGSVFTHLKGRGLAVPANGFTGLTFRQALSELAGDDGLVDDSVEAVRERIVALLQPEGDDGSSISEPLEGRRSKTFDSVTITYPVALEAAVDQAGLRLAEALESHNTRVRQRLEELERRRTFEIPAEALASLARFGLEPPEELVDKTEALMGGCLNGRLRILAKYATTRALQVWYPDDLVSSLEAGQNVPNLSYDPAKGVTSRYKFELGLRGDGPVSPAEIMRQIDALRHPVHPVILPADTRSLVDAEKELHLLSRLQQMLAEIQFPPPNDTPVMDEMTAFFFGMHELAEWALAVDTIGSADRRWFCDGVANYVAIQLCEEQFGTGQGNRIFHKIYQLPIENQRAGDVDLLDWPTAEDIADGKRQEVENEVTYYFFATKVILAAFRDQENDFLAHLLSEVRKTPKKRRNMETVYRVYKQLTGDDLRVILRQTVEEAAGAAERPAGPSDQ